MHHRGEFLGMEEVYPIIPSGENAPVPERNTLTTRSHGGSLREDWFQVLLTTYPVNFIHDES